MKDYSQAKAQLIDEYTSTQKRSDEEVVAFHTGMNYLIDYMSGDKERLNDYIPNTVIYNKRTCVNVNALMQDEYEKKLQEVNAKHREAIANLQKMLQKQKEEHAEKIKSQGANYQKQISALKQKYADLVNVEKELKNTEDSKLSKKENSKILGTRVDELEKTLAQVLKCSEKEKKEFIKDKYISDLKQVIAGLKNKYEKTEVKDRKKIVIAIDSFKGCLTSAEAEKAAAEGVHQAIPECEVVCLPIADGGEGMLDVLVATTGAQKISISAHDPLMQPIETCYGISKNKQTAYIEMASVCGLPLVPPEKRNPMLTTTYGMGEIIRDALNHGCCNFIIGIGGSATNDAGMGMLQALGYRFLDIQGNEMGIGNGESLINVDSIDIESVHPALASSRFTVACDVQNSFYGIDGAAYIFAPQKGADQDMVSRLDDGLRNFAGVICWTTGKDISNHPGAGAAGGLGGSLLAFLDAELKPGIQLMLDAIDFKSKIKGAEFIVTGEGKADRQTLMGKVPVGILEEARLQNIPVMLIAGSVEDEEALLEAGFKSVFSINQPSVSLEQAMLPEMARMNIQRTIALICESLSQ